MLHKSKIINDPLYGLINIDNEKIFGLIQHPYFQRLKNIHQLGFSYFVYPGATHSRFQHSIGAMYLMQNALQTLSQKGIPISEEEKEAALLAILLHDIGHLAFSHALEYFFVPDASHEQFSKLIIRQIHKTSQIDLSQTLDIINDRYKKHFLHQLVSSQLDVDRLDYLNRDSFYTGVSEGVIGSERIIKMLYIIDNQLVAEEKAIYSIEKFIISRRLMYWQVYLHKTVHVAEILMINTLKRAKSLFTQGKLSFISPSLQLFFEKELYIADFENNTTLLETYLNIDDIEIWYAVKMWQHEQDKILSQLSRRLFSRDLFCIKISDTPFEVSYITHIKEVTKKYFSLNDEEVDFFVAAGELENRAYNPKTESIQILTKNGDVVPLEQISDHLNHRTLSQSVSKYFICYPKQVPI
ncbi:MAG: HD domain-containing protein [Bacteroidales bacterium]|jgi:HD superfamily phosphohydrolase|nr:HD domain-containing protein [Bacteroidales bacterium]